MSPNGGSGLAELASDRVALGGWFNELAAAHPAPPFFENSPVSRNPASPDP